MLKRFAGFLVKRRIVIASIFTVLALASLALIPLVNVNYDLTKYLPADSSMRAGIDIMKSEFPGSADGSLRVMFKGLPEDAKAQMADDLAALDHVQSVDYEADSSDYNSGDYTLYELSSTSDPYSDEIKTLEDQIENRWGSQYAVTIAASEKSEALPLWIVGLAMAIIVVILLIMCHSWIEPFLFLIAIGMAVAVNMGTNAFMGSISSSSWQIAAILQLVLSMDYSIMLINRYRQELPTSSDVCEAMTGALAKAIPAILSASITTLVGLLALLFMSFRIGADLGFVLAKGVFCSLVYVFAVLPALIIACDKLIKRTEKPTIHFNLTGLGHFGYRFRYVITGIFVVLFIFVAIYRGGTPISYVLNEKTAIDDVFPAGSSTMLIYRNTDETAVDGITTALEKTDGVKSVTAYGSTIGKRYTIDELVDVLAGMGDTIDSSSGSSATSGSAASGSTGSGSMGSGSTGSASSSSSTASGSASSGSNSSSSTSSGSGAANELIATISRPMLEMVYYDYYRGDDVGTMTLHDFASFVVDTVANDVTLGSQLTPSLLTTLQKIVTLTDPNTLATSAGSAEMAELLGIDEDTMAQLYAQYFSKAGGPQKIKLVDFVDFMVDVIAKNPTYSSYFDAGTLEKIGQLRTFIDSAASGEALDADTLAKATGIDSALIGQALKAAGAASMTIVDFLNYVNDNFSKFIDTDTAAQLNSMVQLAQSALSGEELSGSQIASALNMDEDTVNTLLFVYQQLFGDSSNLVMTTQSLLDFIDDDVASDETLSGFVPADVLSRVKTMRTIVDDAVANKAYTPEELAALLTDLQNATSTAESSSVESGTSGSSSTSSSSSTSGSDESLTAGAIHLIYLYHAALTDSDPTWTLSVNELFNYLNDVIGNDSVFEPYLNDATRTKIRDIAQQITESYNQLVGSDYSRLAVKTAFSSESNEAIDFVANLDKQCSDAGLTDYHLVGQSAMAYEMSKGFSAEQNLIMLITVISIFIIVALTFKSLIIPLILVLLIQCGVFATVVIIGLQGSSIYFIALLIVQCILMGATIDYAILYTTYYREKRAALPIREALGAAYNGSIETILTSGSVLVLVTWLLSYTFQDPAVGQICLTISKGACCALVLIVFVLPSLLAVFDRLVYRKKSEKAEASPTDDGEKVEEPQTDAEKES